MQIDAKGIQNMMLKKTSKKTHLQETHFHFSLLENRLTNLSLELSSKRKSHGT